MKSTKNTEKHFKVWDHTKSGKVFKTLEEAHAYRCEYFNLNNILVAVTETYAKVTHEYSL